MKKLLSAIIVLSMIISALPLSVSASDLVTVVNITVEVPEVGASPDYKATLPANASTEILNTSWVGNLDGTGFHQGDDYTVRFRIGIKEDVARTFAGVNKITAKVNGEKATITQGSNTEITVEYTWKEVGGAAPVTPESELKDKLAALAAAFTATNDTDEDDVIAYLKSSLPSGSSVWKAGGTYVFKIKRPTETATGWISMGVGATVDGVTVADYTFRQDIPALSVSAEAAGSTNTESNSTFKDVSKTAYYADAVKWAVDKKITSGTTATTFSPTDTCTRAHILTFLWRAVGSPKSNIANPFADLKGDDYYYEAALWASETGMVTGKTFDGATPCTRSSTVTYLWQNAGSPETAAASAFTDVSESSEYAKAVAWAVKNNITSGTSETTFSPKTICDRGQIVTFLNRAISSGTKTAAQTTTERKTTKSESITEPAEAAEPVKAAEATKSPETTKPAATATPTEAAKPEKEAEKQQAAENALRPEYDKHVYEKAADEFLTAALGKSHGEDMTELQKALAIHDHLVLNCQYDLTKARKYAHSEYGALVEGLAVCEGYTLAYNDLLSRVGIKAKYVRGRLKSCGDPHAWSGVTIDGKNYHVDVTSDDPTPDTKGSVSHNFFMLSDYDMSLHSDYNYHCSDRTYEKGYLFNYSRTAFLWNDSTKKFYYLDMDKVKTTAALNEKMTPESEKNGFQPDKSVMSADGKYICFFRCNGWTDQYPLYLYCIETNEYYKHLITGIKDVIGCGMRQTGNNIEVITDLYNKSVPVAPKIKGSFSLPASTESRTVTLDTNYEGGEIKECKYLNDDWTTTTIFNNPPKRSGYTFDGWYTEKTDGAKVEKLSELTGSETTLYGHWK